MKKIISVLLIITTLCSVFAMTAFADERFHPSIEAEEIDKIPVDPDHIAEIVDKDGNVIELIPFGDLIVTPYSQAEKAEYEWITKSLLQSYEALEKANSLGDLHSGLDAEAAKLGPYTADDLIARVLFNVYVTGYYQDILDSDPENYIRLKLWVGLKDSSDDPISMVTPEGDEWYLTKKDILPNTDKDPNSYFVIRNDDQYNTVTLHLYDMGSVVLMNIADGAKNPETTDSMLWIILLILIIGMISSGVALIIGNRRKQND